MKGSHLVIAGRDHGGSGRDPMSVRAVLRLYPRPWRERYGEEFAALLSDHFAGCSMLARMRVLADAVRGAADARFNLSGGKTATDRVRGSIGVVTYALIAFGIAGVGFQKMTEDPAYGVAGRQHAAIGTSFAVLRAGGIVAGVIALAAALPLLYVVLRQIVRDRRTDMLRPLILPPAAIAAWVVIARTVALALRPPHETVYPGPNLVVVTVLIVLGAGATACCLWSAITLLRELELPDRLLRPQIAAMVALAACMAVVTGADVIWGLAVRSGDSTLFHGATNGLLATPLPPSWAGGVVVLAVATAMTAWASMRAARTPRTEAPAGANRDRA